MKNKQQLIQEMCEMYPTNQKIKDEFIDFVNRHEDLVMLNAVVEAHRYNSALRRKMERRNKQ